MSWWMWRKSKIRNGKQTSDTIDRHVKRRSFLWSIHRNPYANVGTNLFWTCKLNHNWGIWYEIGQRLGSLIPGLLFVSSQTIGPWDFVDWMRWSLVVHSPCCLDVDVEPKFSKIYKSDGRPGKWFDCPSRHLLFQNIWQKGTTFEKRIINQTADSSNWEIFNYLILPADDECFNEMGSGKFMKNWAYATKRSNHWEIISLSVDGSNSMPLKNE